MTHPYLGLPDRQFWMRDPAIRDATLFDPVAHVPFTITASDRIVTAGSCFAQHLARNLGESGLTHFITEAAHPLFPAALAARHHYGLFSARYGNIYTPRQLWQLLQRAFGKLETVADAWTAHDGQGVVDPFRPQIQPGNFTSVGELEADRRQHFSCVREAIRDMDVFVFTLGLTECWEDTRDGSVFPLAPGVAGGTYDPDLVRFRNFDDVEAWEDLEKALAFIREVNPGVRIILTVSPVPLNATYENRHVYVSTTWSKAVLRIIAEKATGRFPDCCYFPAFEVITSPHVRGRYFAEDCREVLPAGVQHVMTLFFRHFTGSPGLADRLAGGSASDRVTDAHSLAMQKRSDILCDEVAIDNRPASAPDNAPAVNRRKHGAKYGDYKLSPWAARIVGLFSALSGRRRR